MVRGCMGQGPLHGVVDPVVAKRVGDNTAAPEGERLLSMARLALVLCFVIGETKKVVDFCWVIVAFDYKVTGLNQGERWISSPGSGKRTS